MFQDVDQFLASEVYGANREISTCLCRMMRQDVVLQ